MDDILYQNEFSYNGKQYYFHFINKVTRYSPELQIFLIENGEICESPITKIPDFSDWWDTNDYGLVIETSYTRVDYDDCIIEEDRTFYSLERAICYHLDFEQKLLNSVVDYVEKHNNLKEEPIFS